MRQVLRFSLIALLSLALFKPAHAQVVISVGFAPPPLPVYEQPECPQEGWIWVPGYWAWDPDDEDYYWVPGTWVQAPEVGYLWTPPWWGWDSDGDDFVFHEGYWAPEVGFYGGINYGFGYFGRGYEGGRWDHDRFYYNRSVTNVNVVNIHNVYNTTVINNYRTENHVSYNGGSGGIQVRPTAQEQQAEHERHIAPPPMQVQRRQLARSNPQMRASANQGRPPIAATARPTEFSGRGVVAARQAGGEWHPPANRQQGHGVPARPTENNRAPVHANELPQHQAPQIQPNASAEERKYEQQQQKLAEQQNKEHQRLAQQQQKEDQRAQQQQWNEQRRQQMEQQHQKQTQQMQQRHEQRQQQMQRREPPPRPDQKPKPKRPE